MISVKSTLNPAIFDSLTSGKTYVVAGNQPWIEVPKGTTLNDVRWILSYKPEKGTPNARKETFEVEGSKKNKYTVKRSASDTWSCTCVGFGFRRKCKHIENIKIKVAI